MATGAAAVGQPAGAVAAHPHSSQPQHLTDTDPLVKYQTLLPILKESVTNLIKHTVYILQNTSNQQCRQTDMQMLNKCMEDFYNISDQIHHWLVLADSTVDQYLMGTLFPAEVTSSFNTAHAQQQSQEKQEAKKEVIFYSQFLTDAKKQVNSTAQLRSMLTEFADGLATESNG